MEISRSVLSMLGGTCNICHRIVRRVQEREKQMDKKAAPTKVREMLMAVGEYVVLKGFEPNNGYGSSNYTHQRCDEVVC